MKNVNVKDLLYVMDKNGQYTIWDCYKYTARPCENWDEAWKFLRDRGHFNDKIILVYYSEYDENYHIILDNKNL